MNEELNKLLEEMGEAEFECGEWDKNYSEEDYSDLYFRAQATRAAIVAYVQKLTGKVEP